MAPPTAAPPIFAALSLAGDVPSRTTESVRMLEPRAVGQHDRVEADAEPGALLHLAAALDFHHRALHDRAGGNRHAIADADVARDARFDAIFDACASRS